MESSQRRGQTLAVADVRSMPVSVIRHEDCARIAELFDGRKLAVARSVYFAVVQLVAEAADLYGEATRKELAAVASVSVRTLDEFVAALEAGGLIHRVKRREDGLNLPNLWGLGGVAQRAALPSADSTQASSSTSTDDEPRKKNGGAQQTALPLPDDFEAPEELLSDALSLLKRKRKVDTQIVTPEEMAKAVAAIATVNRCSGSDYGIGAHLTAVVMRVRERPSMDVGKHQRLVESAWRIKWWEKRGANGRRPTPAVVYGNPQVFEQVVQDAVDEAAGKSVQVEAAGRPRYTRED